MTQGMTISEQAKALAKKVLDQPATEHDIAVVERPLRVRQAFGCGHASAAAGRCAFPYHLLFDWPGSGESHLPHRSRRQDEGVQRSFG